ncbi:MAG TPA: proline racemase family protein [Candidatus Saccharimonadales bacterium]|nr:proline racemase family protein [Candidatus Saccharimonadales bacterium]
MIREPITTVDYHTGGEPFRIVTGGVPPLEGATVLQRRRWAGAHVDDVRRLLVNEPRGHADMYGGFVTPPNDPGADLGVVFFHNEGYSTACGHGTIALVTWAIESGVVPVVPGARSVAVTVDVPSGRLACTARLEETGRVAAVRFRNVPSYVRARDVAVNTTRGRLTPDVAFGGAFYASLDVRTLGLAVSPTALPELIALQRELRPALERAITLVHPEEPDLQGLYGVIFWEPLEPSATPTDALGQRNVTVFADGEVDRSPCGSGTSARLAILHGRGELAVGQRLHHRSIVDSAFDGWAVEPGPVVGGHPTVITEVEGRAHRTGEHTFTLDPDDPLGTGFLLR